MNRYNYILAFIGIFALTSGVIIEDGIGQGLICLGVCLISLFVGIIFFKNI